MMTDFFMAEAGAGKRFWQRRVLAPASDMLFDARISGMMHEVRHKAGHLPRRDVLVATVATPKRDAERQAVLAAFERSRHRVSICQAPMADRGKFDNINLALERHGKLDVDWLVVTDDDVRLPPDFLDVFLFVTETLGLKIVQPAHRCLSYTSFNFNYRKWGSLGRETRFVECGPITAFHRDVIPLVVPFPSLRWSWGTDIAWGAAADRAGMPIGIVDCTPIEHLRPVASHYDRVSAIDEARRFLKKLGLTPNVEDLLVDVRVLYRL